MGAYSSRDAGLVLLGPAPGLSLGTEDRETLDPPRRSRLGEACSATPPRPDMPGVGKEGAGLAAYMAEGCSRGMPGVNPALPVPACSLAGEPPWPLLAPWGSCRSSMSRPPDRSLARWERLACRTSSKSSLSVSCSSSGAGWAACAPPLYDQAELLLGRPGALGPVLTGAVATDRAAPEPDSEGAVTTDPTVCGPWPSTFLSMPMGRRDRRMAGPSPRLGGGGPASTTLPLRTEAADLALCGASLPSLLLVAASRSATLRKGSTRPPSACGGAIVPLAAPCYLLSPPTSLPKACTGSRPLPLGASKPPPHVFAGDEPPLPLCPCPWGASSPRRLPPTTSPPSLPPARTAWSPDTTLRSGLPGILTAPLLPSSDLRE